MFKVVLGQRGDRMEQHHIGDNLECSRQSDKWNMGIVDKIFSMAITVLVYCSPWKIMWYEHLSSEWAIPRITSDVQHCFQCYLWHMMASISSTHTQRPWHNHSLAHKSPCRGRLHQDRQAFPWHFSQSYQRTDYIEWVSMCVSVCVCVCMIKNRQSLPLGLFTRGQTTLRQTSLPLAPL